MRSGWLWAGVLAAVAAIAAQSFHQPHGFDLGVYRMGAEALVRGHADANLYGLRTGFQLAFTYPPVAAVVFAPLALAPWVVDKMVAVLLIGLAIAALWHVSLRAVGLRTRVLLVLPLTLLSLLLTPVWQDIDLGQVSVVLVLMVVADLTAVPRPVRGALTGLAAAIKLTPLIFLLFLALTRQWRTLLHASVSFAAATALGFVLMPHASWGYWTTYVHQTARIGDGIRMDNQSVWGLLLRLGMPPGGSGSFLLWIAAAGLIAAAAMTFGVLWWRRGERLLGLSLAALSGLFVSPISWYHHWCWVIPLLVALSRLSRVAAVLTAVPFMVARPIAALGGWRHSVEHWGPLEQVVGNAYIWVGLLVVGYAAWRLLRSAGPPPEGDVRTPDPAGAALT